MTESEEFLKLLTTPEGRKSLTDDMQRYGHPVTQYMIDCVAGGILCWFEKKRGFCRCVDCEFFASEEYGCCIPNGRMTREAEIIEVNGKIVGCDLGVSR